MEVLRVDIRTGGGASFRMHSGGMQMFVRCEYLALDRPARIVYTQQFCDEQGNVSRHPGAPIWPETMLTTVVLTEEGANQTRVTVTSEPYGVASAEEIAAFVLERSGMTTGWTSSLDKLQSLLAERPGEPRP
jgi:uncharacterized protein YndB with AHSA1/START domain